MPDQEYSNGDKADSNNTVPASVAHAQVASGGGDDPQLPHPAHGTPDDNRPPSYKSLWKEIRWLDGVNTLVAIAMLVVAFATYKVARDTRDIKDAVRHISALASQTKRQADATTGQLGYMRQQTSDIDHEAKSLSDQVSEMKSQTSLLGAANTINRQKYISSRRAWIAVVGPQMVAYPAVNAPIQTQMLYQNDGGSPATELVIAQVTNVVRADGDGFPIPEDPQCSRLHAPKKGGRTVFPGRPTPESTYIPAQRGYTYPPEVADRTAFLVWQGCFVYHTFGKEHRTHFCVWLRGNGDAPFAQWEWDSCATSNDAD